MITLQDCIDAWNKQADGYNQWHELDCDEKLDWVIIYCNQRCAYLLDEMQSRTIETDPISAFPVMPPVDSDGYMASGYPNRQG